MVKQCYNINYCCHFDPIRYEEFGCEITNMNKEKCLGVIGGLGPVATSHFMELVIRMTQAQRDQDHLNMIIYNTPSIPDRTEYILDHSKPNPLPEMIAIGRKLREQGVSCVAIPCFTAHYFYEELCREIQVPIVNALRETACYLRDAGIKKVGIMATTGTIHTGLFRRELLAQGIEPITPSESCQKRVMDLIYENVKKNLPADMDSFRLVREELTGRGAEVIILGCTELSMIKRDEDIGHGFIDAMEVLAASSVTACGKTLSIFGKDLIT